MNITTKFTALSLVFCLTGCAQELPSDQACSLLAGLETNEAMPDGTEQQTQDINDNGMHSNGLLDNGLSYNQLGLNGLSYNQLGLNALSYNGLALTEADENGLNGTSVYSASNDTNELAASEGGRELLSYAMRCALRQDQSLQIEVNGEAMQLPGALGLAPEWLERPLTQPQERYVSACLLAHVNAFGISVPISLRSEQVLVADAVEQEALNLYEGAFFGSLANGELYTCRGTQTDEALALSSDRADRVCTDGDCGIKTLGMCDQVCDRFVENVGWTGCAAGGKRYEQVVNTFLRADDTRAACGL